MSRVVNGTPVAIPIVQRSVASPMTKQTVQLATPMSQGLQQRAVMQGTQRTMSQFPQQHMMPQNTHQQPQQAAHQIAVRNVQPPVYGLVTSSGQEAQRLPPVFLPQNKHHPNGSRPLQSQQQSQLQVLSVAHSANIAQKPMSAEGIELHDVELHDPIELPRRVVSNVVISSNTVIPKQDTDDVASPMTAIFERSKTTILSHLAFVLTALLAMIIYYISETISWLHLIGINVYVVGGIAGNIAMAIYVVPRIPIDMWDALHTRSEDHGMDIGRRRWLRFCCFLFGCFMTGIALTLYEISTTSDLWPVRVLYSFVYSASGIAGNVFWYLTLLYRFPKRLLIILHKIHVEDEQVLQANNPLSITTSNPVVWWRRLGYRLRADASSYLVMFCMLSIAMVLYYVSETMHEFHHLTIFVFFHSGTAGNIFMVLVVVPLLPQGLWDALHSIEKDHGIDPKHRQKALWQCFVVCLALQGFAMWLYETTSSVNNPWSIRVWYPLTYCFSGISLNCVFYICIISHLPRKLRIALRDIDAADCH